MPDRKAGSSEQLQEGNDMESIGQSAERLRKVLSYMGLDDEQARRLLSVIGVDELTRRLDASDDPDEFLNTFSEAEVEAIADIVIGDVERRPKMANKWTLAELREEGFCGPEDEVVLRQIKRHQVALDATTGVLTAPCFNCGSWSFNVSCPVAA